MKIIEKINNCVEQKKPFFSFEYFPPKTEEGLRNLYARLDRMAKLEPLFVDITWGAGGSTSDLTLEMTKTIQRYYGLEVMMHLTCTNMPQDKLDEALEYIKEAGVSNILALRGDPPEGQDNWSQCQGGFSYASDLVHYMGKRYKGHFGVGVAGYPETHLEAKNREEDLKNLKIKVDAGADFIVTQLFYDVEVFYRFVEDCHKIGINCPIIPGVLPIQTYNGFQRIVRLSQTLVPKSISDRLEKVKDDDAAVKKLGIEVCQEMGQQLLDFGSPGLHFYTLNLEKSVTRILEGLGLISDKESRRVLPWRPSTLPQRAQEDVRPIFWSNRPKSYLARTMEWDDFPNGRWGDSRSPAFGQLNEYYLIRQGLKAKAKKENRLNIWGENPQSEEDIFEVFAKFCRGEIKKLPWCEIPVVDETNIIMEDLLQMNTQGFLTINSQPQVNGVSSSDPQVGWGGNDGYVYQKAYVEFFVSLEKLQQLMEQIKERPTLTFQAVNVKGNTYSNIESSHVNAVTWGVFPGKEIVQPTVVDAISFTIWKDEAFQLWLDDWASLYPKNSKAYGILEKIYQEYYLVNLVENDYIDGDIFWPFKKIYSRSQSTSL